MEWLEKKLASKASDALAASAGKNLATDMTTTAKGNAPQYSTDGSAHFNIDEQHSTMSQIQGTVVTHLATERPDQPRKRIATNREYISYGLQKGHQIRVIHRSSGFKALLKQHEHVIVDLRFASQERNELSSLDEEFGLVVWLLSCDEAEGTVHGMIVRVINLDNPQRCPPGSISWFEEDHRLAIAKGNEVSILTVADTTSQNSPRLTYSSEISCIAASAQGHLVAFVAKQQVLVWKFREDPPAAYTIAPADGNVDSLCFVAKDKLLIGRAGNTKISLLSFRDQEGRVSLASRQTLTLQTQQPMENTLQYVPGSRLVLLANFLGHQLTVLLLSASLNAFSSVTLIDLTEPVFCFDYVQTFGEQDEAVKIYAMQRREIRELNLHPQLCQQRDEPQTQIKQQGTNGAAGPSTDLASAIRAVSGSLIDASPALPALSPRLGADARSLIGNGAAAVPPGPNPHDSFASIQQAISNAGQHQQTVQDPFRTSRSPQVLSGQSLLQALQSRGPAQRPGATPPPLAPTSVAARLPTANLLQQASQQALPRRDSEASSFMEVEALQPTSRSRSHVLNTPSVHSSGNLDELRPTIIGGATPRQQEGHSSESEAANPRNAQATAVDGDAKSGAAHSPRDARGPTGIANSHAGNTQDCPNGSHTSSLPPSSVPPQAPQESSSGRETSLAIIERIQKATARQVKQEVSILHKASLQQFQALRADMQAQFKALQEAQQAKAAELLEAQKQESQKAREAEARMHRENVGKLLTVISKDMNEQVPKRVARHVASQLQELQTSLGTAVQAALTSALPKDLLGGNLQSALEKALATQLSQALTKPLQQNFQSSFQKDVMPAFEAATQSMFAQVQSTFAGGLSEHLQAAGGVNAGIATRLQEAIKDAKDVAAVLSQDVNAACRSLTEYATTIQQQHQAGLAPGQAHPSETDLNRQREDAMADAKRLIATQNYQEAFNVILNLGDIPTLVWLCSVVSPSTVLASNLLSQTTLLILLNQLAHELSVDTTIKLMWIKEIAGEIEPKDPQVGPHLANLVASAMQNLETFKFDGQDAKLARHAVAVLQWVLTQVQAGPFL